MAPRGSAVTALRRAGAGGRMRHSSRRLQWRKGVQGDGSRVIRTSRGRRIPVCARRRCSHNTRRFGVGGETAVAAAPGFVTRATGGPGEAG